MAHRRFHYDRAFEHYLRSNAVPYVAVDEAKRALAPTRGGRHGPASTVSSEAAARTKLKSFDFVVYSEAGANLLIDVKGRKHPFTGAGATGRALQNWVPRDDVRCLHRWAEIFGEGFEPAFAFLFWCEAQPPDALFLEVFAYGERWYAVLAIRLSDYVADMRERSKKWDTVSIPAAAFDRHAVPLKELLAPAPRPKLDPQQPPPRDG